MNITTTLVRRGHTRRMAHRVGAALALSTVLLLAGCGGAASSQAVLPEASSSAVSDSAAASAQSGAQQSAQAGVLATFTAQDLDGNAVDGTLWQGNKLTMVNVWATYCGPCLSEMPELGALSEEYADKGVQIVGVAVDTLNSDGSFSDAQIASAKQIVEQTGASYLHLLPSEDLIRAKLAEFQVVPATFFVDENGNIVGESYLGSRSGDDWKAIIDATLAAL